MIYWAIFILVCLLHLYCCYMEMERARKITKLVIMPMLILYLLISKTDTILLYIALSFSFLGDLFLILKFKHHFITGAISFFIAHLFYITIILSKAKITLDTLGYFSIIILLIIYIIFVYLVAKRGLQKYTLPTILYILTLVTALAISLLTKNYLVSLGYLLFIISDSILITNKFIKPIKKRHLYIMFTYILAQVLIILGLM